LTKETVGYNPPQNGTGEKPFPQVLQLAKASICLGKVAEQTLLPVNFLYFRPLNGTIET
jgi:hypothetical protein